MASARDEYHDIFITREDESQVIRTLLQSEYTFDGTTCTYRFHFVYANGELRVEKVDSDCN